MDLHRSLKLSMKTYLQSIVRFLLLLVAIQIIRAFIITGLWRLPPNAAAVEVKMIKAPIGLKSAPNDEMVVPAK